MKTTIVPSKGFSRQRRAKSLGAMAVSCVLGSGDLIFGLRSLMFFVACGGGVTAEGIIFWWG